METEQTVKVYNRSNNPLPSFGTQFSAAVDLRAALHLMDKGTFIYVKPDQNITIFDPQTIAYDDQPTSEYSNIAIIIQPNGRALIPTGLHVQLPPFHSFNIRPRSGLALKFGITMTNSPGTVDEDYRGDVGVILHNTSDSIIIIPDGERIAQMKIEKDIQWKWDEVETKEDLTDSARGEGGFNSTGTK